MMNLYILDSTYSPIAVIDSYKSLIWTKRYYTYGDFELYMKADKNTLEYLKPDYFVIREDDDSVMVIEKFQITTDPEEGDFFIISGRSLESILLRRVITTPITNYDKTPLEIINNLVQTCTYSSRRQIPGLVVDTSYPISETLSVQFTGSTLLDAISAVCTRFYVGLKMTVSNSQLILSFYQGSEVGIVFSPEFDNLINSDYTFDYTNYSNFAHVAGEGEGSDRRGIGVSTIIESGLAHREMYVDARDLSSNNGEISDDEYVEMLRERGLEKLDENSIISSFENEIEPNAIFEYKKDYSLGDVVTVENGYGVSINPRIVEIIESWDESGYTVIPTFEEIEAEKLAGTLLKDSNGYVLKDNTDAFIQVKG